MVEVGIELYRDVVLISLEGHHGHFLERQQQLAELLVDVLLLVDL